MVCEIKRKTHKSFDVVGWKPDKGIHSLTASKENGRPTKAEILHQIRSNQIPYSTKKAIQ